MPINNVKHGPALTKALLSSTEPLPIGVLEERLHLSRRSLYYTIKQINLALSKAGLDEITNLRGVGYLLPNKTKNALTVHAQQRIPAKSFHQLFYDHFYFPQLSQDDRQLLIIFALISRDYTSLNQLATCFCVSKNTIITDLKQIKRNQGKDLSIVNTQHGKKIASPETVQRRWVFSHFNRLVNLISPHITYTPHSLYEQQLQILEKITAKSFTENSLKMLSIFIQWIIERLKDRPATLLPSPQPPLKCPSMTVVWVSSFFNDLGIFNNQSEGAFLDEIISTQALSQVDPDDPLIQQLRPITSEIIQRFNNLTGVHLPTQEGQLIDGLTTHLVSTYYRVKYHLPYHNPLLSQIKHQYRETFEITRAVLQPFNAIVHQPLNDDEVALITTYFSSAILRPTGPELHKKSALVVCSSGIGTSELLISQLRQHYPTINFIGPYNTFQYENASLQNVQVVISTVPLPTIDNCRILTVPVIPNSNDWQQIDRALVSNGLIHQSSRQQVSVGALMDIIANYARIVEPDKLEAALHSYVQQHSNLQAPSVINVDDHPTTVSYITQPLDWQTAIRKSFDGLIQSGIVKSQYSEQIIKLTQDHGDYMAIGKGVFLAHAAPNAGVNRLGFSYTLFRYPFLTVPNSQKKIKIIVGIAPVDQQQHLGVLSRLLQCLQNEKWVKAIQRADSLSAFQHLLEQGKLID